MTFDVASETVACQGEAPQQCLLVREHPAQEWTYFYDPIAGFEHERGFEYTIRVSRTRLSNPPMDGSSVKYRLLEVLRKEPA